MRNCANPRCLAPFQPNHPTQLYCDIYCVEQAYRLRRRAGARQRRLLADIRQPYSVHPANSQQADADAFSNEPIAPASVAQPTGANLPPTPADEPSASEQAVRDYLTAHGAPSAPPTDHSLTSPAASPAITEDTDDAA